MFPTNPTGVLMIMFIVGALTTIAICAFVLTVICIVKVFDLSKAWVVTALVVVVAISVYAINSV